MSSQQVVPEELAEIPPGPQLSAALSGIDLSRSSGFDCVRVLKARYRQLNHDRAAVMAAMVEVGLCGSASGELARMPMPDEFSADEIRAALMLTRRAADAQFELAYDLITRLPAVHAAMDAGWLDEPRARVLSEWTTELSLEQARAVCDALLPRVSMLTTGQLVEQVKRMAIALDPAWAQRRYEQAVVQRKVVGYRNPDGSANLSGLNLPVDRVAAACGHIDALAKAAKHAGDSRPIDHIRAELFLGMTDGTYAGLDETMILARLRASTPQRSDDDVNYQESGDEDALAYAEPQDSSDEDVSMVAGDAEHHDSGEEDAPEVEGHGESGEGGGAAGGGCGAVGDPIGMGGRVGAGMELRARLSTLLGRDEYPGELAGWGPIHAGLARNLVTLMARGQWRFAITDARGQLLQAGITRARPTRSARRWGGSREIVELQIPAATLRELASDLDALGNWAPVITDLAQQYGSGPKLPEGDPTRRFPGTELRRYVQIRDRYCIGVGCRAPARGSDADHTIYHAHGGATADRNLGHPCRHDHRLKHDGGWRLDQPEPGHFRWTSRLGHAYHIHPRPIIEPLPDPLPRAEPLPPLHVPLHNDLRLWDDDPPERDTGLPPPQPPSDPTDDPPPF